MNENIQYPFKTDHDIFVALIEDFNHSVKEINHLIGDDHNTTLEVKKLLEQHYDTLSKRIDGLEETLQKVDPEEIAHIKSMAQSDHEWIRDFKRTRHFLWVIACAGFILLGYYIPNFILTVQRIFGIGK